MSKLEWNAPGCYYILRYRKVNIGYVVPWETEKIGDPRVHVFAVSNPGYYQLWEFKIRAGNQENLGTESPVRRSFSGQNAPAVKPESAEVEAVTASTVALAWEPVTLNKGSVDGYKVCMILNGFIFICRKVLTKTCLRLQYHCLIKHAGHNNKGNNHQR